MKPTHLLACWLVGGLTPFAGAQSPSSNDPEADRWRADRRLIDLHLHIEAKPERIERAVRILDRVGVGIGVNLTAGTVTRKGSDPSEFERTRDLFEKVAPGRFLQYFNLDYADWDAPDFGEKAAAQVDEARRLGAAGLKEYKRLGLYLRDGAGKLLRVDDPKLDPVWRRCGEVGLPVSIHVADPRAFWLPFDSTNERWKELRDHRPWWFGDAKVYPAREELLDALDRVIGRHPGTTFVCVHFANNAEDLDWVERALDRRPNMWADLAARIPEVGRHDPAKVRRLFERHADRIVFATDFQVHGKLILGSSGDDERPTDDDAVSFFEKHWRFLETTDRDFAHMTPIQGDWTISGIGLSAPVLRKIYFDNARRLLARALPSPVLRAVRVTDDEAKRIATDPPGSGPVWGRAQPVMLEQTGSDGRVRADLSTEVRAVWSSTHLHLAYRAPYTRLTTFEPPEAKERIGLWERDVVEAFIGSDPDRIRRYTEFQVAPNGMKLDLRLDLPERDFDWDSGMTASAKVDEGAKVWSARMSIPLESLSTKAPSPGTRWRINLYRCDYANNAFLTWRPTLDKSFHVPERFGVLEFGE
ncbi:MAG: amidohydrolase family protein [Limisphaerales bacterium]